MKTFISLLILTLCFGTVSAHGGHMATFRYDFHSDGIHLEFKIEEGVLAHFPLRNHYEHYDEAKALCIAHYMQDKVSLLIKGKEVQFEMQGANQQDGYFTIQFSAQQGTKEGAEISIQNTSFYEFDSGFENRVIIGQNGAYTSYRLNRDHDRIQITALP